MTDKFRKFNVKFIKEEHLRALSDILFPDSDVKLLNNMRDIYLSKNGDKLDYQFQYKRVVKRINSKNLEWKDHWKDLTEFNLPDIEPYAQINIHISDDFSTEELIQIFGQNITERTNSLFYPAREVTGISNIRVLCDRGNPQYPIYIISKGRSENCITADHLIKMDVPFKIVIEKQEWEAYAKHYGEERLLELDMRFKDEYDTYIPDFDESKSKGSGPARNFVWWHSKNVMKSDWHWIMDDNIYGFFYLHDLQRIKASDGSVFAGAEDFVNRYDNIGISGMNYHMFAVPGCKDKPYVSNTKIYSCLLINNHIPIRWAGRYNEDVDLCIRALKEGYSTIQFDAFLAKKAATQTVGGGNTEAFYAEEGTLPKSNQLAWNHPDVTDVTWRFSRWHHITDYSVFENLRQRTIQQTIMDLNKPQILHPENDAEIIGEIQNIDFVNIKKWDILQSVQADKREQIIDVLKYYRYCKDNQRIIDILTRPRILNCDLSSYIWNTDFEDTEDNKIMVALMELADDNGKLFYSVDWDSYLDFVPEPKRKQIVSEMVRNKYLQKEYKKYSYNFQIFKLSDAEHSIYEESKAYLLNEYVKDGKNHKVPLTFFDKKIRKMIKTERNSFQSQLTKRTDVIKKQHDKYTLMIHGDLEFNDEKQFEQELSKDKYNKVEEIINSVYYPVDLMAANHALELKLSSRDFVPDDIANGKASYRVAYDQMSDYADECLLFIGDKITDDIEYLIQKFNKLNKPLTIIKSTTETESIDDWD